MRTVSRALMLNLIVSDAKYTCPQFPVLQFNLQLYENQAELFHSYII